MARVPSDVEFERWDLDRFQEVFDGFVAKHQKRLDLCSSEDQVRATLKTLYEEFFADLAPSGGAEFQQKHRRALVNAAYDLIVHCRDHLRRERLNEARESIAQLKAAFDAVASRLDEVKHATEGGHIVAHSDSLPNRDDEPPISSVWLDVEEVIERCQKRRAPGSPADELKRQMLLLSRALSAHLADYQKMYGLEGTKPTNRAADKFVEQTIISFEAVYEARATASWSVKAVGDFPRFLLKVKQALPTWIASYIGTDEALVQRAKSLLARRQRVGLDPAPRAKPAKRNRTRRASSKRAADRRRSSK